jgi:tellurite resistance protein TehA-like permease
MQDGNPIVPPDRAVRPSWRGIVSSRTLYGCFAFVMATGIVSIAAHLTGLTPVSNLLLGLNLSVFVTLWVLLLIGLIREPGFVLADARNHDRAPRMLSVVAATCVVGNEIALASGGRVIVTGLWAIAAVLWCGLTYLLLAAITSRAEKPPLEGGIDGSWLLVVVATEALAILTIRMVAALALPGSVLFASLCLFLLGGAFYGILLSLIVHRWCSCRCRPIN